MSLNTSIPNNILKKKLVTLLFVTFSVASFATLGDGGKKNTQVGQSKNLLSAHTSNFNFKTFSLKSGYDYRGNSLFNFKNDEKFIMLNTVITYQKGNATYILPLKKKVILDKIKFNPAPNH